MVTRVIMATGLIGVALGSTLSLWPATTAQASVNPYINFQGKLVNTDGTNIPDGTYNIEFKIYTGGDGCEPGGSSSSPCGGSLQWTEDYLVHSSQGVSVSAGIFQVNLGSITALPSVWNSEPVWLSINLGNTSSSCTAFSSCSGDGEMLPFIQFTSAPYALNSNELGGLTASQFAQLSPASAQSGNLNVTGDIQAGTALQAPLIDTATAGALDIGTGTATSVTIGQTSTPFTIQGNSSSDLTATNSGHTTTVGFTTPTGTNSILFPNAGGTICTTVASTCSGTYLTSAGTYLAKNSADTSSAAITAANYLYGFTNSNATPTTGGVLDLSNGANTGNTLYVTASGNPAAATNALIVANNTAVSPSGNLLDLQQAGANELSVDYQGNLTQNGGSSTTDTINGQTISAAAKFTGTVTVGSATTNGAVKFLDGTADGFAGTLSLAGAIGSSQTYSLPTTGGTICLTSQNCSTAGSGYILNQSSTPGTAQTGNFNVTGTGIAGTALQSPLFDTPTAGVLAIGTTNATAIDLNQSTVVATAKNLTVTAGATSLTGSSAGSSTATNIITGAASNQALTLQGASGQTGNLFANEDSNGVALSKFDANGDFNGVGTQVTLGPIEKPTNTTTSTGTSYYYEITATNNMGESEPSTSVGMANNTSAITWNQVTGATGYKIYRNTTNSFTSGSLLLATITNGSTVSYTDTGSATGAGLPPTTAVGDSLLIQNFSGGNAVLVNGFGNVNLNNGENITGTINSGTQTSSLKVSQISGARGEIIAGNGANNALEFQDSNNNLLSGFSSAADYTSDGTNNSFLNLTVPTNTTTTSGTSYYYVITATNAQGETVASTSVGMANNTSAITWNQVTGATGYKIYRNTSNSFTSGSLLAKTITNGSTVTFTDTGAATVAGLPPTGPTGTGVVIQGWSGQTASLLQAENAAGSNVFSVGPTGTTTIGSTTNTGVVNLLDGTADGFTGGISLAGALGSSQTYSLPTTGGTFCLTNQNCSTAGSGYILNQSGTPGTAQTGNFNISGTGIAGTALQAPLFDVASAGTLSIGTGTATAITVGKSGVTTTVSGPEYINTNSGVALKVEQSGVHSNTLVVDTGTGSVGIGQAPSGSSAIPLVVNGAVQAATFVASSSTTSNNYEKNYVEAATNGGTAGQVVVLQNDSGTSDIITTTTKEDTRVYGVVSSTFASGPNTIGQVVLMGPATVTADAGIVAIGDQLVTSSTIRGDVTVDDSATTGILGIATSAKGAGAGSVTVSVHPVNGETNPNVPGNLTVQGSAGVTVGSTTNTGVVSFLDGSADGYTATMQLAGALGSSQTYTLPTTGGTFCLTSQNCSTAGSGYILNQSSTPGTAQTGNFNISGTGVAGTALQSPLFDTPTAAVLAIGTNNATAIDLNQNSVVASGKNLTVTAGSTSLTGSTAGNSTAATILAGTASNTGLVVQGTTAQTGNLVLHEDVNGVVLSKFDQNGSYYGVGTTTTIGSIRIPTNTTTATGTSYYYVITATNASGESAASSSVGMSTNTGTITWSADPGATGYKIYRNTSNSFTSGSLLLTTITNGSTLSYTDSGSATVGGLPPTTELQNSLVVTSETGGNGLVVNGYGNTTLGGGLTINGVANNAPQAGNLLINQNTGSRGIVIEGQGTANAVEFQDRNGDAQSGFSSAGNYTSYGTNNSYLNLTVPTNTTTSSGTSYYYVITATNAQGETVASTSVGMANNTSAITWNQVNGATGYKIYRNTSNSFTSGSLLAKTINNGTTVSYTDTGAATTAGLPPTTPTGTGVTIQGWSGQTASLLQAQNAAGSNVFSVGPTGTATIGTSNVNTGTIVLDDGASSYTATINLQGTLPGNATYQLPNLAGTQTICTTNATSCSSVYEAAGSYLLQNPVANDGSTSNFAGYQYSFTQSNAGAAGNLQLTNSGTNPSLDVVGSGNPSGTNALEVINNSAGTPSGNSLDIQKGGVNELSVDYNGNINQLNGTSTTDTINGQTISAAANFTGTVTAATSVLTPLLDTPSGTTTLNIGTTNASAGIDLNQNTTILGALSFSGSGTVNFTTPLGSTIPTKINIPLYTPPAFGQVLAFGLPSGAPSTSRAITILDDRPAGNNEPPLDVISPNENNSAGITWDGQSSTAYFITAAPNANTTTPNIELQSGNVTGGTAQVTGNVYVDSGNGTGTTTTSGNVYVDAGTATGTVGSVNIGTQNTLNTNIGGNSAGAISIQGGTAGTTINTTSGNLTLETTTSGTLGITSAGAVNVSGAAASTINTGANTLAITSSNFNVSTGGVLNVVGGSAGYQIGGAATTGNYLRGNGTSFVSSAIQSGDIPVCTGTCHYISNQITTQTTANFDIQSAASGDVGGVVQGATSQTADLLDLRDSTGSYMDSFSAGGNLESIGYYDNGTGGIGPYGNALEFSEALATSPWAQSGVVPTNNSTTAPDGNNTATKLVGTGISNTLQSETAVVTDPTTYTFSVWLKDLSGAANTGLCIFATGGSSSPTTCTATAVTPNSTDWQRFSVTQAIGGSGATSITAEILPGNGATATVYAWGAQLVAAGTPEVYVRTTTAAVAPTNGVVSNDLLTANSGATVLGAATSINASSNFSTSINTGTSTGAVTIGNSSDSSAISVQGGSGNTTINDTSGNLTLSTTTAGNLSVTSAAAESLTAATTLQVTSSDFNLTTAGVATYGSAAGNGGEVNNGSTTNSVDTLANFGSSANIAQAAIDNYTYLAIPQTTTSIVITPPAPTAATTYGKILYISNTGTTGFTMLGQLIGPGTTAAIIWANTNGAASWTFGGDGNSILNQNTYTQTGNFLISGTGQANTSILTALLDTPAGTTTLNVGTTNATAGINLNQSTVVATGKNLTVNSGTLNVGSAAGSGALLNNGSTTNTVDALANMTSSANITQSAIDNYTYITIAQTTASITATVPAPTANTVYGKVIYIANIGTAALGLTTSTTQTLAAGSTATLVWTNKSGGAGWSFAGADAGTLQSTYNASGGAAPSIAENTTNAAVTIQSSATSGIVAGNELFGVRAAAANDTTLGASALTVDTAGVGIGLGSTGANPTVSYNLQLGNGGTTGQTIEVTSAAAAAQVGAALTVQAATGNTSGIGGQLNVTGGTGGNAANGGQVVVQGGAAGGGNTSGGAATIQGGTAAGTGTGGQLNLNGGLASATAGSASGAVALTSGAGTAGSGATNGGASGAVTINSGNAGAGSGTNSIGGSAGNITITGGNGGNSTGTAANSNGGSVFLVAGNAGTGGSGTNGVPGVVSIDSPEFTSTTEAASGASYTLTQSNVDGFGTDVITESTANATVVVPAPRNTNAGRVFFVMASNGSLSFTLSPTGGPSVNMNPDDTEMLEWNGNQWTAEVSGSSLQQVYDNTTASPASIVTTSAAKTLVVQAGVGDDAANLLTVNNSFGSTGLSISTNSTNLIYNSSIEENPLPASGLGNWVKTGAAGASVARSTTVAYAGNASLALTTTATLLDGAMQSLTNSAGTATALTASTTYYISWYANGNGTAVTNTEAEYSYDGTVAHAVACNTLNIANGAIPATAGWTRYTCQFTTGSGGTAPVAANSIMIVQNVATAHTFYIDAVQLQTTGVTPYEETTMQLATVVTSPVDLENTNNSVTAFSIQNSSGVSALNVDTLNNAVTINDSLTQSGGAYSLTGNAASTLATTVGGITVTSAAAMSETATTGGLTIATSNSAVAATGGGNISETAGNGDTSGGGGSLSLTAGTGGATGVGGTIGLTGGAGGGATEAGGNITIQGGNGNTTGTGGNVTLQGGTSTGTAGSVIAKAGTNAATTFQVQNSTGGVDASVDTADGNGCEVVGLTTGATPTGNYTTCNGQTGGNGTLIIDSGTSGNTGLNFAQVNSTQVSTSSAFTQLLGVDSNGNVGVSNAAVSLTSPALAYWSGTSDPKTQYDVYPALNNLPTADGGTCTATTGMAVPCGIEGGGQATAAGVCTSGTWLPNYNTGVGAEELTPTCSNTFGSINWTFAQVQFEEVQFQFQSGGGNGADATWFYGYANTVPTTEYGCDDVAVGSCNGTTGPFVSEGYIVYFDEYWDCIGIEWASMHDGNQCTTGGANDPLAVYSFANLNGAGPNHYAADSIDDGNWHNVDIQFEYNQIIVRWDGQIIIDYSNTLPYTNSQFLSEYQDFGFGSRNGGNYNNHYIKGLLVTKLGTNTSQFGINNANAPLASNLYWDNGFNSGNTAMNQGALGVGTADPTATLEVDGSDQFDTQVLQSSSTVSACQSNAFNCTSTTAGTDVFFTGTTALNSDMIGDKITFFNGYTDTIQTVPANNEVTVANSKLEESNNTQPGVGFTIYQPGLSITGSASSNTVQVGSANGGQQIAYLGLNNYQATSGNADPAGGVQGDMYYNSATDEFRCNVNGAWQPCNGIWQTVMRTADAAAKTNTTFAADSTLTFAMAASTNYSIRCQIYFGSTSATPQFKWEMTGPAGATTIDASHEGIATGGTVFTDIGVNNAASTSNPVTGSGVSGEGSVTLNSEWQNGTTAGTWAFNWAENATNATGVVVRAGSYCDYVTGD